MIVKWVIKRYRNLAAAGVYQVPKLAPATAKVRT